MPVPRKSCCTPGRRGCCLTRAGPAAKIALGRSPLVRHRSEVMRLTVRFRAAVVAACILIPSVTLRAAADADADQRMSAGRAAMLRGDTGGAEDHWLAAAEMYRRAGDVAGRVEAMGNLGAAYQWAGDYDQAIKTLREARALAEANGLRAQLASIDNSLGAAYTF